MAGILTVNVGDMLDPTEHGLNPQRITHPQEGDTE